MSIRNFGVLGHSIKHTMSPFIHGKLFELSGHPGNYSVLDVPAVRMSRVVKNVLNVFNGYNVTIPYKNKVIPYLDELDEKAACYGSVNTVVVQNGHSKGYTTDADGLLAALDAVDMPLDGRVVILGSGGAARVMAYEAAIKDCDITFAVKEERQEKALELAENIRSFKPNSKISVCTPSAIEGDIDLLMNATPVGMYPNADEMPVTRELLSRSRNVFDAVYNPQETKLIKAARAEGAKTLGGMSMLVWQAAAAHKIWDNADFNKSDIDVLCEEASAEMLRMF